MKTKLLSMGLLAGSTVFKSPGIHATLSAISRARRINATGEIVGEANISDGGPFHAVKWTVGTVTANTAPTVTLVATSPNTISAFKVTLTVQDARGGTGKSSTITVRVR